MTTDTVKTDIIISIHPKHVKNIVSRAKDHEYRKYLIPTSVRRMWIYKTSPLSAIKYVALISNGKRPGEVANNEGLRNKEFNDGKLEHLAKYAYEILELYTLPEVLPLAKLITNGWLKGPPQKFCYAKRQMVETTDCLEKKFVSTSAIVQAGVIQSISSATLPLPPKEKGSDGDGSHKRTYDAFMSAGKIALYLSMSGSSPAMQRRQTGLSARTIRTIAWAQSGKRSRRQVARQVKED
jgi:hypothetical protein